MNDITHLTEHHVFTREHGRGDRNKYSIRIRILERRGRERVQESSRERAPACLPANLPAYIYHYCCTL